MRDGSKRTIAIMTAAVCLGAGGWALADSVSAQTGSSNPIQDEVIQTTTTAPSGGTTGHPCDHAGRGAGPHGPARMRSQSGSASPAPAPDTSVGQAGAAQPT